MSSVVLLLLGDWGLGHRIPRRLPVTIKHGLDFSAAFLKWLLIGADIEAHRSRGRADIKDEDSCSQGIDRRDVPTISNNKISFFDPETLGATAYYILVQAIEGHALCGRKNY